MTAADEDRLTVAQFEAHAAATDQLDLGEMDTPILGLVGEVGSLVSALKKKRRDTDGFFGYHEAVVEELGDVLWYVSAVARRGGSSLVEVIEKAAGGDRKSPPVGFDDLMASDAADDNGAFEHALLELAGEVGSVAKRFTNGAYRGGADALRRDLVKFVRPLSRAAGAADVTLAAAARDNLNKIEDRWPTERRFPAPRDGGLHIDEQLPRRMRVLIYEREVNGTKFVFQKSGGMLLGDRLTDNHLPDDDYRFHDVFHLAYAAVLGWSPTTRALLKIKRKSQKAVDENEDGARANLIEEGLTTWIFETAKQHRFFANTPNLGLDLLKDVKRFVRGYEAEKLPMWLWESAILQGYAVFRELQVARSGVVLADLDSRRIWVESMTEADRVACGIIA
ncbi:nucleoside triphosphate pyrophosphohydrolase family protein [Mesorhizobium sp.]|uniref:nucleoside triphosphate pyrophosphohydrolase family protein n=1 Tax=Mesorhizobium sp. TaxID=1871066 RepID=UPI000FE94762|nr:nucleoside triphosphate pyrophosphohydrolase family protein [Mesorhizobium sp.]RWM45553.1 MAG: pyrophosphatase [Mesorhizobium sp.]RWM58124.1 MAG: pyrophosphatase [Mesorhizobium sp.]RWM58709.1 MAG: pyrophosphatase [Mesorhizobium sp.]TIO65289.1 MAG: pyrophosphatase [Mesorhizobium sp.]TJV85717.1 MAG: pyrophosphatase [Mesorhizobium sp.]